MYNFFSWLAINTNYPRNIPLEKAKLKILKLNAVVLMQSMSFLKGCFFSLASATQRLILSPFILLHKIKTSHDMFGYCDL